MEKREVRAGSLKIKYLLKMIRNRMGYIHIYTCVCVYTQIPLHKYKIHTQKQYMIFRNTFNNYT